MDVQICLKKEKLFIASDVIYSSDSTAGETCLQICRTYGFDPALPERGENPGQAESAYQKTLKRIENCDIITADMNGFRGYEPDGGICFMVGLGYALGKRLYLYVDDEKGPTGHYPYTSLDENGVIIDKDGIFVSQLDQPVNLMLGCSSKVVIGDFENCIRTIASERDTAYQKSAGEEK